MEVPACALNRRSSTVLVRIMDICEFCNRRGVRAFLELEEPRASYCELCSRVTSFGQTRAAEERSERKSNQSSWINKKIKVYASYILLLMGGLPPAYGAPHLTKVNLCDVAYEAQNAYNKAMDYSEEFKKTLISNKQDRSVEEVLSQRSEGYSYLKNSASFVEVMLPECKSFSKSADEACLAPVTKIVKTNDVTTLQQQMYRALNFMVTSFEAMSQLEKLKVLSTPSLNKNISETIGNMRYPLLILEDYLLQNNDYDVSLKSINQEELPKFEYFNKDVAIVFKDSMNFVQYFAQVFDEMSTSEKSCIKW